MFSDFMNTSDGRRWIYYQLPLNDTPSMGLVYEGGDYQYPRSVWTIFQVMDAIYFDVETKMLQLNPLQH